MKGIFHFGLMFALAAIALFAPVNGIAASASAKELRVGIYQNKPKIFVDRSGNARGILISYLSDIARLEHWKLEYVDCDWTQCLTMLAAGQIDIMPDVAWNEERAGRFSFGKVAALNSWLQFYARPGERLTSILDLKGKRIAVLASSVEARALSEIREGFGIDFSDVRVTSFADGFRAVESGKADLVITNNFYGDYHLGKYDVRQTPIMFHPSRLFFAAPLGTHAEVLAAIDRHLAAWKADPNSIYYSAISKWSDEPAHAVIPAYMKWLIAVVLALFMIALAGAAVLRRQVALRTADLRERNANLAEALDELARTRERAMEQERLHVLGRMASGIAHDFNNNLMLILGHVELLRAAIEDGLERRENWIQQLRVIEDAGHDATAIVKRMRDFYKRRHDGEPQEPIFLDKVAENVLELTRPRWAIQSRSEGAAIELSAELEPVPAFKGTRSEVREALLNLVINAIDAMDMGGRLTLRTGRHEDHVFVEVRDTGKGMSREELQQCLRPFYTTKGKTGTGMGLSMVASMMERYAGHIEIDSVVSTGSRFTLVFPLESGAASEPGN